MSDARRRRKWLHYFLLDGLAPLAAFLALTLLLLAPLLPDFTTKLIGTGDVTANVSDLWHAREAVLGREPWFSPRDSTIQTESRCLPTPKAR
ncbi:MAG: hypothetical protein IPK16_24425 [Anaerolineales bacterium]|nr:hypothetical protein [Anaerolineales bacterium]